MTTQPHPTRDRHWNFNCWKAAVGLPQSFPRLAVLTDAELDPEVGLYMGYAHGYAEDRILDSAKNPLVAVLVDVGHGCTTLSRYIHKTSTRTAVRMTMIPVRISVDDLDPELSDYLPTLLDRARQEIVRSLILLPWDRPLKMPAYATLIGAERWHLVEPQRIVLAAALGIRLHQWDTPLPPPPPSRPVDWDEVGRHAPSLALAPRELIRLVTAAHPIAISVQLDLSSSTHKDSAKNTYTPVYHDLVRRLSSAVKGMHEQEASDRRGATRRGENRKAESSLNVMLFTSQDGLDTFTAEWDQPFDSIEYPRYGPPDVFAILSYHYPQKVRESGIVRTNAMAAVLSDELVADSYDSEKSLHGIMEALENSILELLPDWEKVRIRLEKPRE